MPAELAEGKAKLMVFLGVDWGPVLTDVFMVSFPVLLAWALAQLHQFLPKLAAKYQAAFTTEQRATIEAVVRTGVLMAEQLASRPDIHDLAMSKKELAFQFVDKALSEKHIALSASTISGEIEAAVYDEFHSNFAQRYTTSKPVVPPATALGVAAAATGAVLSGPMTFGSTPATAFMPVGIAPAEIDVTP